MRIAPNLKVPPLETSYLCRKESNSTRRMLNRDRLASFPLERDAAGRWNSIRVPSLLDERSCVMQELEADFNAVGRL